MMYLCDLPLTCRMPVQAWSDQHGLSLQDCLCLQPLLPSSATPGPKTVQRFSVHGIEAEGLEDAWVVGNPFQCPALVTQRTRHNPQCNQCTSRRGCGHVAAVDASAPGRDSASSSSAAEDNLDSDSDGDSTPDDAASTVSDADDLGAWVGEDNRVRPPSISQVSSCEPFATAQRHG